MRIDKNVVFLGNKLSDDLVRCYCESDIFFSASKMETQGMVFLEAAACGLPLLGLRYMSVPEIIINNFNGFCRSENDFSELTDNLLQLIKGPDLRRQFSENSRKIAQSHDIKDIVLILQDIYRQVSKNFNNY